MVDADKQQRIALGEEPFRSATAVFSRNLPKTPFNLRASRDHATRVGVQRFEWTSIDRINKVIVPPGALATALARYPYDPAKVPVPGECVAFAGQRVMAVKNLPKLGLINGQAYVVHAVLPDEADVARVAAAPITDAVVTLTMPPKHLILRLDGKDDDDEPTFINIQVGQHKCYVDIKSTSERLQWKRLGFLVVPFYACTYHKVQGMTLSAIVLDPSEDGLTTPQFMVGITRVRSLQHLALLSSVKATLLRDFGDADVIATYASLREKQKSTLQTVLADMESDDEWLLEDARVVLMRAAVNASAPATAPMRPSTGGALLPQKAGKKGGKKQQKAPAVRATATTAKASASLRPAVPPPRPVPAKQLPAPDLTHLLQTDFDDVGTLVDKLQSTLELDLAYDDVARLARTLAQHVQVWEPGNDIAARAIARIAAFENNQPQRPIDDEDVPMVLRNTYTYHMTRSILMSVITPRQWLVDDALGRYAHILQRTERDDGIFYDTGFATTILKRTPESFARKWDHALPSATGGTTVIFPAHVNGNHFVAFCVNMTHRTVLVLDSLGQSCNQLALCVKLALARYKIQYLGG